MTLHDIVFGLVGILMAYISWLLLRLLWLGRRKRRPNAFDQETDAPSEIIHSEILGGGGGNTFSSAFYDGTPAPPPAQIEDTRPEPRLSRPLSPDASEFGFDALLEVRQTRLKLDELQHQHEQLQQEVDALRDELAELRAASQVSPVYSEAVGLARRGYDAEVIAARCGISVAEAELVRSLSSDGQEEGDNA